MEIKVKKVLTSETIDKLFTIHKMGQKKCDRDYNFKIFQNTLKKILLGFKKVK